MKFIGYVLIALLFAFPLLSAGDNDQQKESKLKIKKVEKESETKIYKKRKASNPEVVIETDFGTMKLELFRDVAPVHVDSMLSRIREGFYNGFLFYRIIDRFMIQAGEPSMRGGGYAGYYLKGEFSKLKHLEGTLSMARGNDPNSASCQFFICLTPQPHLDSGYTIFGHLMEGYDVLHEIGRVKVNPQKRNRPLKDVYIRKMYIIPETKKDGK